MRVAFWWYGRHRRQDSVTTMVHASLWMSSVYELVKAYDLWVLFIGITLECMGIPVPGETVLVSAALYAGSTHRLTIGSVMLVAPPWPSVE